MSPQCVQQRTTTSDRNEAAAVSSGDELLAILRLFLRRFGFHIIIAPRLMSLRTRNGFGVGARNPAPLRM